MSGITSKTTVNTTELATVLGVTPRRVRQLVEDRVIEKGDDGFNLCNAVQLFVEYKSSKDGEGDPEFEKLERDRKKAETSMKVSKALIESLKAKELQGAMHRSEDVAIVTADLIYSVRSALLALPGRMAVELANINDPAEASAYMQQEVYKVLEDIAAYQYDPKKYEELVRARMNREPIDEEPEDNG